MGQIGGLATKILDNFRYASLFTGHELEEIKKEAIPDELDIPNLLLNNDWGIPPVNYIRKCIYYSITLILFNKMKNRFLFPIRETKNRRFRAGTTSYSVLQSTRDSANTHGNRAYRQLELRETAVADK